MAFTEWRTHLGKKYLFIDHGGTEQETLDNLKTALAEIKKAGGNDILVLADSEKAYGTTAVMNGLSQFGKEAKPFVKKWAVIGVVGVKKLLLKTFNALTGAIAEPKNNTQEALDYLFNDKFA